MCGTSCDKSDCFRFHTPDCPEQDNDTSSALESCREHNLIMAVEIIMNQMQDKYPHAFSDEITITEESILGLILMAKDLAKEVRHSESLINHINETLEWFNG